MAKDKGRRMEVECGSEMKEKEYRIQNTEYRIQEFS
jgi:hypothetical protein